MTDAFDEHGDRLRRALRAEADAVMPSPDGLDRIRAHITVRQERRRLPAWMDLPWLRPVAAAAAAVAVTAIALAAPPVINNLIVDPAGNNRPGAGQRPPGQSSGNFPAVTPSPGAPVPTGTPTPQPTPAVTATISPSVTATCQPPNATEPPTPDPSASPSPAAPPTTPCSQQPRPPASPKPNPSQTVEPTSPSGGTSQDPDPGPGGAHPDVSTP